MWFKSDEHKKTFVELEARARAAGDSEYEAALYALAAAGKSLNKYVSAGEIDFEELMEDAGPWSSGEKALVKLAATLFNSRAWPATIQEVFYSLDQANCQVALEALRLRYTGREGGGWPGLG